jgi:hypothetical protein
MDGVVNREHVDDIGRFRHARRRGVQRARPHQSPRMRSVPRMDPG